tara:strand:- start:4090 stop:4227 length:138 start_codon:yes stop_codon:yes gene_type:complete
MNSNNPNDRIRELIGPDGCDRDFHGSDPDWMREPREDDENFDEQF